VCQIVNAYHSMVTFNSTCDINCLQFRFIYKPEWAVSEAFWENEFCISQGSVVTVFRYSGQMQNSSGFCLQKSLKSVHFWQSYSRNNMVFGRQCGL